MIVRQAFFQSFFRTEAHRLLLLLCVLFILFCSFGCTGTHTAVRDEYIEHSSAAVFSGGDSLEMEGADALSSSQFGESKPLIENIQFTKEEYGELIITLEASQDFHWRRLPSNPGRMHFMFPGVSILPSFSKVYQLHDFLHPVKNALLRSAPEGGELIISTTAPVSVTQESAPGILRLSFGIVSATSSELMNGGGPTEARLTPVRSQDQFDFIEDGNQEAGLRDSETVFPGMRQEYSGQPISIDLQNTEVEHVLRLISEIGGYNLILDPEVSGKISMKLDNVPWDQVLDLVLLQKGLGQVRVGNIMRISTIQRLGAESKMISDARAEAARARIVEQELEPVQTTFIQVNYSTAAEMDARTRPFLTKDRGNMSHDPRTNTLIVTDIPANIRKIRGVVERLDRPERQVLIEARVVYATENFQRGIGIQWGGGIEGITTEYYRGLYGTALPGAGGGPGSVGNVGATGYLVNAPFVSDVVTFGIGGFISKLMGPDMFTLDAQLQLGEVKGESRTVSSPRIVTLNNNSAEIEQGMSIATQVPDERGTRTDYVDAVLKLTVLPQITPDDTLILDLFVSDDSAIPGGDIEKKQAKTKLLVENGQIIVLGGVLKTTERLNERRVPGVADVPVLGWLFKNRLRQEDKQELLIFIRPTIL